MNNTKTDHKEHTYRTEDEAKRKRRKFINLGFSVSLVAYDGERDSYVFDVYF